MMDKLSEAESLLDKFETRGVGDVALRKPFKPLFEYLRELDKRVAEMEARQKKHR